MSESPWWRAATAAERAAAAGAPPAWWERVEAALAPGTSARIPDRDDDADATRGALRLVAPFVRQAQRALREQAAAAEPVVRSLARSLAEELVELSRPAVALDLVAARAAGGWDADDLVRETAAAMRELGSAEGARALLHAHPSLARMIAERTRLGIASGRELLERIDAGLPRAREELLGGADNGALTEVALAGDAHEGGRRVARLSFEDGAHVMLKPRSLAADRAFAQLLGALNELGFAPAFRPLATLDAGNHGWQAWAQPASCASAEELERYFRRLGGQLAILHALRATDMHQENVLACGEHPMLVDLETVLHPRLGSERAAGVDPLIAETGLDCVLRVGLLPRADVAFGVDIGGLGRDPEALHEATQLGWVGSGADARLVAQRLRLEAGDNAPRLDGRPVRPHAHLAALAAGFSDAYGLLVEHRDRLLTAGGALAAFRGVPTRVVLRPTKVYVDLLRRQTHDLGGLDDGVVREEALAVLWRGAARRPELRIVAPAERYDLWAGDVPKLTTRSGSADGLHHALGELPGMLGPQRAPAPDVVERLDARDLARQLAFLRSSVLAAAAAATGTAAAAVPGLAAGSTRAVAARLAVLALRDDEGAAGWLAPVAPSGGGSRVLRPVGPELATGQAGIATFLTLLGRDGPEGLAAAARRRLWAQLKDAPQLSEEARGGLLLALAALADSREDRLAALGEEPVGLAAALSAGDVGGSPQLVLGLAALVAAGRDDELRRRLRERAAALARDDERHGATTALALAAAVRALGDERLATAAHRAAAGVEDDVLARVAALTAAADCGMTADLRHDTRDALERLEPVALELAAAPTARRYAAPVILRAAAAALGERDGAQAAARAATLAAALAREPPRFEGGAETPLLDDGLAGIGIGMLALDGEGVASRIVTAAYVARGDAQARSAAAASSAPRSVSASSKP